MTHLQTLFEQYLGKDVILYTTDGSSDRMINCGSLPTLFTTVDFGAGKESKAELHGVLSRLYSRRDIEWSPVHQTCKILKELCHEIQPNWEITKCPLNEQKHENNHLKL